jgi:hypothetical protein
LCEYSSSRASVYVSVKQASTLDSEADARARPACLGSDRWPIIFGENVLHMEYVLTHVLSGRKDNYFYVGEGKGARMRRQFSA